MLRILFSTNSPFANTGYASTLREVYKRIASAGHSVAVSNFFGQEGYIKTFGSIVHYPRMKYLFGEDAMVEHGADFNADVVISNQDTWLLDIAQLQRLRRYVPWVPIDHEPLPPAVAARMKIAHDIIACSRFGQLQLERAGFKSAYIPYSVDTQVFKPMNRARLRRKYNIPRDAFVFGMVAANKSYPPRKAFQEVMDAFKVVAARHENARLFLHVPVDDSSGFPIVAYAETIGIQDRVLMNRSYDVNYRFTHAMVAEVINTFDVSVNPSNSEGFGLNIIESQSCGVPVIINDATSQPELIVENVTGWKTRVGRRRFTPLQAFVFDPDVNDLAEKMEESISANRAVMGAKGRKHVVENYDSRVVFNKHWKPYLQGLDRKINGDGGPRRDSR